MNFASLIAVALGGGAGSILRYTISRLLSAQYPGFPIGTLVVNLAGSFLIGLFAVLLLEKNLLSSPWREMILVGFLGGLTTFSTFALDSVVLFEQGRYKDFALYAAGNFFMGVFLLLFGRFLGRF